MMTVMRKHFVKYGSPTEAEQWVAVEYKILSLLQTMVDWNGDITLCCNDWYRQAGNMGNIQ